MISFLLSLGAAATLSVLTPLIIVVVRHEIRVRRIRLIDEFSKTFGGQGASAGPQSAKKKRAEPSQRLEESPSFEFVKSKYSVDLDHYPEGIDRSKLRALELKDKKVDDYVSNLRWYDLRSNWRILFASIPYVLTCLFGFFITLAPISGAGVSALRRIIEPVVFTSGGLDAGFDIDRQFEHLVTVSAIAFVGAYLYTLRLFIRAVAVFDLSTVTFIRASAHLVMTFALVAVMWRALPDPMASLEFALHKVGATEAPSDELVSVPASWFILAFVLGFVPDSGLQFAFNKVSRVLKGLKTTDERFSSLIRSTPLDVIDGIDFFTRFRLEEANVFEVQNLAVANPIMLHIETPFGIYQTIDWVAQAQLCTIAGPERFLMFRQYNIRTIFDLERAVLSHASTPGMRRFIASILLMPTQTSRDLVSATGSKFNAIGDAPSQDRDTSGFNEYVVKMFGETGVKEDPDRTIKHMVRVIVDDLHVQRLRQVWMHIAGRLGSSALSDTEDPPDESAKAPDKLGAPKLGAAEGTDSTTAHMNDVKPTPPQPVATIGNGSEPGASSQGEGGDEAA